MIEALAARWTLVRASKAARWLALLVVIALCVAATGYLASRIYAAGFASAKARGDAAMASLRQTQAEERAQQSRTHAEALRRYHEDASAQLAQQEKEKRDAAIQSERTVADLRTGNLRLRRELAARNATFTAYQRPAGTVAEHPEDGDAGLWPEDAEFLVREADRADGIVRDLNACNDARRLDRALLAGGAP